MGSSADFTMGTGDFTIECWGKFSSAPTNTGIFQISSTAGGITDSNFYDGISVWSGVEDLILLEVLVLVIK